MGKATMTDVRLGQECLLIDWTDERILFHGGPLGEHSKNRFQMGFAQAQVLFECLEPLLRAGGP